MERRAPIGVEVRRGNVVESAHRVHLAVVDGQGGLVKSFGDASFVTFLRSAAKPLQAAALVSSGAADRYALTPAELAVACGSHHGEARHAAAVLRMLARIGLDEAALQCGTHAPRSANALTTPLHHNCSGNHAGLILLQAHLGGDPASYQNADSPAQRAALAIVEEACGEAPKLATDGCGIPAYALPLTSAARAYARLAMPQGVSKTTAEALQRVARAMSAHPEMVGGAASFDSDLMGASEDRLLAKAGAEGVQCVADLASGMGLALKIEDGDRASRAATAATVEALRQLAWLEGRAFEVLGEWWMPPIRQWDGAVVGDARPVLVLE